ncbi:MAG: alpha/beta hydrolase [Actinomycetota bacterium]
MTTIATDDGVRLHAERRGAGPALVLVHGITESSAAWAPLVDRLAAERTVVTVDLRGHGQSTDGTDRSVQRLATDVHAAVTELDLGTVDVIGHSLGGMVAAGYAALFEPRRVVVVDQPLALSGFRDQLLAAEEMLRGDAFEAFMTAMFDEMAGPLATGERERLAGVRRPVQETVLGIWSPVLESAPEDLDALVAQIGAGISAPLLSLHGIDPGPDYAAWLTQLVPSTTFEVWADHGHYPHLVDPSRFLARVDEFLA